MYIHAMCTLADTYVHMYVVTKYREDVLKKCTYVHTYAHRHMYVANGSTCIYVHRQLIYVVVLLL